MRAQGAAGRRRRGGENPAPNNVGVVLLATVVVVVVAVVGFVAVPAAGKFRQQTGCATSLTRTVTDPNCVQSPRR